MTTTARPELPKTYDPAEVEPRLYARWLEAGVFHEEPDPARPPFIISMPPPNVTGRAHLGHGSTYTPQDVLTRYHRMLGENADWLPGQDHAAIATETVLIRELAKEGATRESLGPRSVSRARVALARAVRRRDQRSVPAARVRPRLGARALHDGRRLVGRRHQGVRRPLRRRADLPRHAAGELGSASAVDALRCRSRRRRARHVPVAHPLSRGERRRRPRHRDDAAGDVSRRRRGRRASRRRALPRTSSARTSCCRSSTARSR